MSAIQKSIRKENLFDNSDIPRISLPAIRGIVRASAPDNTSTEYYWPSLATKTLIVYIAGTVTTTITITFTGNGASTAVNDVKNASAHISAAVEDGYFIIKSLKQGANNLIRITGGTALGTLGFYAHPRAESQSVAGDFTPPPANSTQASTQLAGLITKDSLLDDISINKAIAALATLVESYISDLDRQIATPVNKQVTVSSGTFSINTKDEIYTGFTTSANPGVDVLNKWITFTDTNNLPVIVSGVRSRVASVTYGDLVNANATFNVWGTFDGKSIFGSSSHWQLSKATASIVSIKGNTITATGANFITKDCQPNNTVLITGATNTVPFSHNGEYLIDKVIDENTITIKQKSTNEDLIQATTAPSELNARVGNGESLGTVTVLLGKFTTLSGAGTPMVFQLSPAPPDGTYNVVLPIGRTSRTINNTELATLIAKEVGGLIELGSKFVSSSADALKPRINATIADGGTITCLLETRISTGPSFFRIYMDPAASIFITVNAYWNGSVWNKDIGNNSAFSLTLNDGFTFNTRRASSGASTWTLWDSAVKIPINTFDSAGATIVYNALKVGGTISNDTAGAIIPRLQIVTKLNEICCVSESFSTIPLVGTIGYRQYTDAIGTFFTVNAKWSGTNWACDSASFTAGALKYQMTPTGVEEYVYTKASTTFLNGEWVPSNTNKNWSWDEEFMLYRQAGTGLTACGQLMQVVNLTNAKIAVDTFDPTDTNELGTHITQATAAGAFSAACASLLGVTMRNNFVFRTKVKVLDKTVLAAETGDEFPGIFIGIKSASSPSPAKLLGISTGSDVSVWKFRNGQGSTINTTVPNTDWATFTITRRGSNLYFYANDIYVSTAAIGGFLGGASDTSIFLTVNGTATANDQRVCLVDYIKYRLDRNYGY